MILAGVTQPGKPGYPWLVFLHGFSGDRREWQAVGASLKDYPRLYLDLPGHGESAGVGVTGFAGMSALLTRTLISYNILKYWLVGYSLGGRIAMFHACQRPAGLNGLIVEGGHPGLLQAEAREARLVSDRRWASRFRGEPLENVFADWYQQPVFASLTQAQRRALIALRSRNNGLKLAEMLEATSLAVQPDLRPALSARDFPFYYLYGERDEKFNAIAAELNATRHAIPHAGHNAHRENPDAVAASLAQILRYRTKDTL
ncbi:MULTISPECIES: 2-succinyl-6-hydroxy-2,4-cyclohexadiene-1-carboxylate synthase [Enterobacter cloacae complex]|uniref:2-succinyl-6-hydroxy-2,4-cyclohexadiene-1-carboxylate synthase n=1 Tax=Enterobacter cloacae TaxID=550 RepID=A0A7H8UF07_ENTCL|nr:MULTISPECIES: 2-succinyl-6-hydroxy-2,4-cyclohexadiene-1-carboxylate synthase [Enterobacter cloacae complex]MDE4081798.1 2-succinyl-6-hydroxy-2,4-cyclohexadiene-1-carboxylate synthase [Enterobacter pasteurii]QKZ98385.1 2-succinyl-6-hydroxy-2,4-cyclohexadiene-1-carboxylate synthase [Enterobacter cloacae]